MSLTKIAGVWKKENKNGDSYLYGPLSSFANLVVMKNKYKKEGDKSPDYYVCIGSKDNKAKPDNSENDF